MNIAFIFKDWKNSSGNEDENGKLRPKRPLPKVVHSCPMNRCGFQRRRRKEPIMSFTFIKGSIGTQRPSKNGIQVQPFSKSTKCTNENSLVALLIIIY
jgi:hypothetical protein